MEISGVLLHPEGVYNIIRTTTYTLLCCRPIETCLPLGHAHEIQLNSKQTLWICIIHFNSQIDFTGNKTFCLHKFIIWTCLMHNIDKLNTMNSIAFVLDVFASSAWHIKTTFTFFPIKLWKFDTQYNLHTPSTFKVTGVIFSLFTPSGRKSRRQSRTISFTIWNSISPFSSAQNIRSRSFHPRPLSSCST